jgi:hypothetical protein
MSDIELTFKEELEELVEKQNVAMNNLYDIQYTNPPSNVCLTGANSKNTYDIDLSTRTIHGPATLSVARDHKSTVIYFKVDRYFDFMDLSNTICVVEYKVLRENKEVPYIYVTPFLDTQRHAAENKMIFPWVISGVAARQDGIVEYAIRFYRLEGLTSNDSKIVYDLHTLPAKSTILAGLNVNEEEIQYEYDYDASYKDYLAKQIADNITYWHTLE